MLRAIPNSCCWTRPKGEGGGFHNMGHGRRAGSNLIEKTFKIFLACLLGRQVRCENHSTLRGVPKWAIDHESEALLRVAGLFCLRVHVKPIVVHNCEAAEINCAGKMRVSDLVQSKRGESSSTRFAMCDL